MKVRIKFAKEGALKFIGHLDIMRYFQKAFRRSGLDIQYSQGFSPHPLLSFAAPLGLGLTSEGEYMDVVLGECPKSREIVERLNDQMVDGMRVLNAVALADDEKNAMSLVAAADYRMTIKRGKPDFSLEEAACDLLSQKQILVMKKTKKSLKETDIRPMIHGLKVREEDGRAVLYMRLAAGSAANLKPEQVAAALWESKGALFDPMTVQFHRLEMYDGQMVPLDGRGDAIE